jgi:capsular polysaccharide biosynthesis protein
MSDLYQSGSDIGGTRHSVLRFKEIRRVPGAALPLTFTPDVHLFFSHVMLQCLPRLLLLDEIGYPDAKIIVPHNLRRKQFDMLRLAGIGDDRIVKMPPGVVMKADMLLVPRTWPLAMSPFTARIYETMMARVLKKDSEPQRRVLISRESRRTWRNMVTYDAVRHMLVERHGFEVVRPETLTLEEEILMFNHAKVVVGAEGAGLYASVFCQDKANVISLCDEDYMMPILGTIAKIRDFSLYHVFGESFRADSDLRRRLPYGHCDFAVDPVEVDRMVLRCV